MMALPWNWMRRRNALEERLAAAERRITASTAEVRGRLSRISETEQRIDDAAAKAIAALDSDPPEKTR